MNLLLDLTLRGAAACAAVALLELLFRRRMAARWRRLWWAALPLAFLFPWHLPALPRQPAAIRTFALGPAANHVIDGFAVGNGASSGLHVLFWLWLAGTLASLALVSVQTVRATRNWSGERPSTDHDLLELLEDCKAKAGLATPIALIITPRVPSPAILGWLRPRLLLPTDCAKLDPHALRPILLHELAHHSCLDVPAAWLVALIRSVHWFNPAVHLAAAAWGRYCEEAADEQAMAWLNDPSGQIYGAALIALLKNVHSLPAPFGALTILESPQNLKKRMTMIAKYPHRPARAVLASVSAAIISLVVLAGQTRAEDASPPAPPASAAVVLSPTLQTVTASMVGWLAEIDAGKYEASWTDASESFQKAGDAPSWATKLHEVRDPIGKCLGRGLLNARLYPKGSSPNKQVTSDLVVAQFKTSFENLAGAIETVAFVKEPSGTWKSAGYFIKPAT